MYEYLQSHQVILLFLGGILNIILSKMLNLDTAISAGLFAGALTSTPGLAAAQEATQSPHTSTGYGIASPAGVISVRLFIKFMPDIFKSKTEQEEIEGKNQIIKNTTQMMLWTKIIILF